MASTKLSQSSSLPIGASVFATIFVGFGINAMLRPEHALSFFEMKSPALPADKNIVDAMMVVYGARDIFMGLAIYSAAYFGSRKSLGWTLIAASSVAFVDGIVCKSYAGLGEWGHWGYAPVITALGAVLIGLLD